MATILECSELTKKYGSHRAVDGGRADSSKQRQDFI